MITSHSLEKIMDSEDETEVLTETIKNQSECRFHGKKLKKENKASLNNFCQTNPSHKHHNHKVL